MIALVCVSVTAPAIYINPTVPYFKVEALLAPLILVVYLWLLLIGVARRIRLNAMFIIGLLFFLCNAFSIWYGDRILGHTVIYRDLYELPKVWLPVAFFIIAYEADLSELSLRRLLAFFSFAILLVCVYAWGQFFGLGFAYRLNPYYSMGGHIDVALEYARRVYATMGNANVLGSLLTWCVLLFMLAALFRVGNQLRNIVIAAACLVTLVMTGSRYGLLSFGLGFLLVLLLVATTRRQRFARVGVLLLLLPTCVLIFEIVAASNPRTLVRYESLREPLQIDSFRERVEGGWLLGWSDFKSSPMFGHGPGKGFLILGDQVIDSEFLNVLREKGSIGFVVFLGYYLYPLFVIWKGRGAVQAAPQLTEKASAHVVCMYASLIMGTLALFMNVGMSTFYSPFLQGFLWLWLGIGAGCASRLSALVPMKNAAYAVATHLHPRQAGV